MSLQSSLCNREKKVPTATPIVPIHDDHYLALTSELRGWREGGMVLITSEEVARLRRIEAAVRDYFEIPPMDGGTACIELNVSLGWVHRTSPVSETLMERVRKTP